MRNGVRNWLLVFFTAVVLAGASCGYRFSGAGEFPYGVKTIAVEVLENRTSEAGLENTITDDLIFELSRSGRVQVAEPGDADAVIKGTIRKLAVRSVSRSQILTSEAERVFISLDLRLVRPDGEVLWKADGLEENESYPVAGDKLATEDNRRRAIENLSPRLAQKIYNRITSDF